MMTTALDDDAPARPPRLRPGAILVLQCVIVIACVLLTTSVAIAVQERSVRSATTERVLEVARSLATLDQVRGAVAQDRESATAELQPLADLVSAAAGVDYVVITDASGVRITHPTPSERGRIVSTDPSRVLAGEDFIGVEEGTIGPTLRAKIPVRASDDPGSAVIGTASVGILESEIDADVRAAVGGIWPWVIGSVIVGCLASALLAALVGRRLRRLEGAARRAELDRRVSEARRDQLHEFHTRLHAIRGLVAAGESSDALTYIAQIAPVGDGAGAGAGSTGAAAAAFDDPALSALVEALAAEVAERAGARLEVAPLSAAPRGAVGDDDLVVAANLVRNAADALAREADGEARAEASARPGLVRMLVLVDDTTTHIAVDDDGPGVAPAEAERIFRRGYSSRGPSSQRGVGLDVVRRIARRRGGAITLERSTLGGARFVVEMPREEAP